MQEETEAMKEKLDVAIRQWDLTEVKVIYENSYKAVYSAISEEYGAVILKLNRDTKQLAEEYEMLHKLDGNGCCKVFAYDRENGMLLEERLMPGTVLRKEEDLQKRIEAFASVFHKIHCRADVLPGDDGQPPMTQTYLEWLEDIYRFCRENNVEDNLTKQAKYARDICAEMFEKYSERMLLHGDLHHDNILMQGDGNYAMIDPKGVIGPEILEVARFIMNELDTKYTTPAEKHMREVVRLVSEAFGFPREDVAKVYFMEVILGNVWSAEDGEEVNAEEIAIATQVLQAICC